MNAERPTKVEPFTFKDCALIAIATGRRANSLKEFRDLLDGVGNDSLYYHFWGGLLHPRFEEREYNNDFAAWVRHGLHDATLAERLAMVDPTRLASLDEVRQRLLEQVEDRLEESEYLQWARATVPFEFIRSQIVVFDTHSQVDNPAELADFIASISLSGIFYHFIDARRRSDGHIDDFRSWLSWFGDDYRPLIERLGAIDPYFSSLAELRQVIMDAFADFFGEAKI
jgi:hypothetical protein